MQTPFFSIVIPTFNRAKVLNRAIKSVINQTFSNWEALIIDNSSIDNTASVVNSFKDPRIKFYKIDNKGIIAASRNLGIKNSEGKFIAFLDSDDWWEKQKLEYSYNYINQHKLDLVYHQLYAVDGKFNFFKKKIISREIKSPMHQDLVSNGNAIPNSSAVIKKSLLKDLGYISEDRTKISWEDFDTWIRATKVTEKIRKIKLPLGSCSINDDNTSSSIQTIKNHLNFKKHYKGTIKFYLKKKMPWWVNYPLAKDCLSKKKYNRAYCLFDRMSAGPQKIEIKKKIFQIFCICKKNKIYEK